MWPRKAKLRIFLPILKALTFRFLCSFAHVLLVVWLRARRVNICVITYYYHHHYEVS